MGKVSYWGDLNGNTQKCVGILNLKPRFSTTRSHEDNQSSAFNFSIKLSISLSQTIILKNNH